jgi:hypothetical protein
MQYRRLASRFMHEGTRYDAGTNSHLAMESLRRADKVHDVPGGGLATEPGITVSLFLPRLALLYRKISNLIAAPGCESLLPPGRSGGLVRA